jgi:hypothetical protein
MMRQTGRVAKTAREQWHAVRGGLDGITFP